MNRPTTGVLRVLRSAVVTVVIIALATVAHVAGGGYVPSGLSATAVVVLLASVVHLLTRWRLNTAAVFALLGAGQLVLHQVFMALDSARTGPLDVQALNAVPVGRLAHAHSLNADLSSMSSMSSMHAAGSAGVGGLEVGPWVLTPMLAAHVIATLLSALILSSAERALWRLWAWLAPLVVALLAPAQVVVARLPRAPRTAFEHRPVHEVVLARALSRRGPPVGLVHA
ncbi:hypothetical protein [Kineococcus sp. SYSU DK005]|uniref:hypothetical protein n=1 Tax=Kineococcus sp. SYSU DK005 TaxID=3383126 RepID=UPI003D7EAB9A